MEFTEEDLKKAYRAFKKKLKLQQLEDDSKLGRAKTTGARSTILSIQPPAGHGREIWTVLAERGYLKDDGGGCYALTQKQWA
jgi:hypothetical protein